jgi:hypothetical protein
MISEVSSNITTIGEHTVAFEPPDICVVRLGKTMTAEEAIAVYAEELRLAEEHGEIFLLGDCSRFRTMAPDARKLSAEMTPTPLIVGMVYFGISFHVRVLSTLVMKLRRLAKLPVDRPVIIVADEAEARAAIAEQRRLRRELKEKSV